MRYFIVGYAMGFHDGGFAFGDVQITRTDGTFLNQQAFIQDMRSRDERIKTVTMLSIIEVNKDDAEKWCQKMPVSNG